MGNASPNTIADMQNFIKVRNNGERLGRKGATEKNV